MKRLIIPILTLFILFSCSEASQDSEIKEVLQPNSVQQIISDTLAQEDTYIPEDTLTSIAATEVIEELTDLNKNSGLKDYVTYLHEVLDDVENPIQLVYEGADFGDYFHLSFAGPNELYIDFGDGDNDFGEYELYDPLTFDDNPKYIGQTFQVFWEFKPSTFPCCEGDMELLRAEVPSIVKLELIEH